MQHVAANQSLTRKKSNWIKETWNEYTTFLEENRQHIYYLFVFFAINAWLFFDKFFRKFNMRKTFKLQY